MQIVRRGGTINIKRKGAGHLNKINEIAKKKNISKMQIVRSTGISRSHLYEIIDGISQPTIPIAWKIAKALDSDISEVFPYCADN